MKYTYAYKTSDGVRHEAVMNAASREEVFSELRKQGIKAIKVVASDGSKANGEIRGIRKRMVFVFLFIASVLVAATTWFLASKKHNNISTQDSLAVRFLTAQPLPRQNISGDRSRIDLARDTLSDSTERFLAAFAEPGRTNFLNEEKRPSDDDFIKAINSPTKYAEDEFTEAIDLKRIISGIKKEALEFLRGGGSVNEYIIELTNRQKLEISYRTKAEATLKKKLHGNLSEAYTYWLKVNAGLESMGIYPLPLPTSLREFQLKSSIIE